MAGRDQIIYPDSFAHEAVELARQLDDPNEVADGLAALRKNADPAVVAADPASYAPTLSVARLLYRNQAPGGRDELMKAILNLSDERLGPGLAAAVSEAIGQGDWRLVGRLSLMADHRLSPQHPKAADSQDDDADDDDDEQDETRETARDPSDETYSAFIKLVESAVSNRRRRCWTETVTGYLEALPDGFLPPPDLCEPGVPVRSPDRWCLLRRLLSAPAEWWISGGRLAESLRESSNEFVRDLGARHAKKPIESNVSPPAHRSSTMKVEEFQKMFDDLTDDRDAPEQFERPEEEEQEASDDTTGAEVIELSYRALVVSYWACMPWWRKLSAIAGMIVLVLLVLCIAARIFPETLGFLLEYMPW